MKKIISSILIVFLLVFCFNITNVFAYDDCSSIKDITNCQNASDKNGYKCYWDPNGNVCTSDNPEKIPSYLENQNTVSCGKINNIPDYIPYITSLTITVFTIISMGMLVIMGTVDLFKGINSGKPDDMKKNQKVFFSRIGSAVFLFFIVALTRLLVNFIVKVSGGGSGIIDCIGCFINNKCM